MALKVKVDRRWPFPLALVLLYLIVLTSAGGMLGMFIPVVAEGTAVYQPGYEFACIFLVLSLLTVLFSLSNLFALLLSCLSPIAVFVLSTMSTLTWAAAVGAGHLWWYSPVGKVSRKEKMCTGLWGGPWKCGYAWATVLASSVAMGASAMIAVWAAWVVYRSANTPRNMMLGKKERFSTISGGYGDSKKFRQSATSTLFGATTPTAETTKIVYLGPPSTPPVNLPGNSAGQGAGMVRDSESDGSLALDSLLEQPVLYPPLYVPNVSGAPTTSRPGSMVLSQSNNVNDDGAAERGSGAGSSEFYNASRAQFMAGEVGKLILPPHLDPTSSGFVPGRLLYGPAIPDPVAAQSKGKKGKYSGKEIIRKPVGSGCGSGVGVGVPGRVSKSLNPSGVRTSVFGEDFVGRQPPPSPLSSPKLSSAPPRAVKVGPSNIEQKRLSKLQPTPPISPTSTSIQRSIISAQRTLQLPSTPIASSSAAPPIIPTGNSSVSTLNLPSAPVSLETRQPAPSDQLRQDVKSVWDIHPALRQELGIGIREDVGQSPLLPPVLPLRRISSAPSGTLTPLDTEIGMYYSSQHQYKAQPSLKLGTSPSKFEEKGKNKAVPGPRLQDQRQKLQRPSLAPPRPITEVYGTPQQQIETRFGVAIIAPPSPKKTSVTPSPNSSRPSLIHPCDLNAPLPPLPPEAVNSNSRSRERSPSITIPAMPIATPPITPGHKSLPPSPRSSSTNIVPPSPACSTPHKPRRSSNLTSSFTAADIDGEDDEEQARDAQRRSKLEQDVDELLKRVSNELLHSPTGSGQYMVPPVTSTSPIKWPSPPQPTTTTIHPPEVNEALNPTFSRQTTFSSETSEESSSSSMGSIDPEKLVAVMEERAEKEQHAALTRGVLDAQEMAESPKARPLTFGFPFQPGTIAAGPPPNVAGAVQVASGKSETPRNMQTAGVDEQRGRSRERRVSAPPVPGQRYPNDVSRDVAPAIPPRAPGRLTAPYGQLGQRFLRNQQGQAQTPPTSAKNQIVLHSNRSSPSIIHSPSPVRPRLQLPTAITNPIPAANNISLSQRDRVVSEPIPVKSKTDRDAPASSNSYQYTVAPLTITKDQSSSVPSKISISIPRRPVSMAGTPTPPIPASESVPINPPHQSAPQRPQISRTILPPPLTIPIPPPIPTPTGRTQSVGTPTTPHTPRGTPILEGNSECIGSFTVSPTGEVSVTPSIPDVTVRPPPIPENIHLASPISPTTPTAGTGSTYDTVHTTETRGSVPETWKMAYNTIQQDEGGAGSAGGGAVGDRIGTRRRSKSGPAGFVRFELSKNEFFGGGTLPSSSSEEGTQSTVGSRRQ